MTNRKKTTTTTTKTVEEINLRNSLINEKAVKNDGRYRWRYLRIVTKRKVRHRRICFMIPLYTDENQAKQIHHINNAYSDYLWGGVSE